MLDLERRESRQVLMRLNRSGHKAEDLKTKFKIAVSLRSRIGLLLLSHSPDSALWIDALHVADLYLASPETFNQPQENVAEICTICLLSPYVEDQLLAIKGISTNSQYLDSSQFPTQKDHRAIEKIVGELLRVADNFKPSGPLNAFFGQLLETLLHIANQTSRRLAQRLSIKIIPLMDTWLHIGHNPALAELLLSLVGSQLGLRRPSPLLYSAASLAFQLLSYSENLIIDLESCTHVEISSRSDFSLSSDEQDMERMNSSQSKKDIEEKITLHKEKDSEWEEFEKLPVSLQIGLLCLILPIKKNLELLFDHLYTLIEESSSCNQALNRCLQSKCRRYAGHLKDGLMTKFLQAAPPGLMDLLHAWLLKTAAGFPRYLLQIFAADYSDCLKDCFLQSPLFSSFLADLQDSINKADRKALILQFSEGFQSRLSALPLESALALCLVAHQSVVSDLEAPLCQPVSHALYLLRKTILSKSSNIPIIESEHVIDVCLIKCLPVPPGLGRTHEVIFSSCLRHLYTIENIESNRQAVQTTSKIKNSFNISTSSRQLLTNRIVSPNISLHKQLFFSAGHLFFVDLEKNLLFKVSRRSGPSTQVLCWTVQHRLESAERVLFCTGGLLACRVASSDGSQLPTLFFVNLRLLKIVRLFQCNNFNLWSARFFWTKEGLLGLWTANDLVHVHSISTNKSATVQSSDKVISAEARGSYLGVCSVFRVEFYSLRGFSLTLLVSVDAIKFGPLRKLHFTANNSVLLLNEYYAKDVISLLTVEDRAAGKPILKLTHFHLGGSLQDPSLTKKTAPAHRYTLSFIEATRTHVLYGTKINRSLLPYSVADPYSRFRLLKLPII